MTRTIRKARALSIKESHSFSRCYRIGLKSNYPYSLIRLPILFNLQVEMLEEFLREHEKQARLKQQRVNEKTKTSKNASIQCDR